jgi:hypothetical protein
MSLGYTFGEGMQNQAGTRSIKVLPIILCPLQWMSRRSGTFQ